MVAMQTTNAKKAIYVTRNANALKHLLRIIRTVPKNFDELQVLPAECKLILTLLYHLEKLVS